MKKSRIIIGTSLTLLLFYLFGFKPWLRAPSQEDFFYFDVAVDFNVADICDKIHRWAYETAGFSEYPINYVRSYCYQQVAFKTRNPKLCKKVIPLTTLFRNGRMTKDDCIYKIGLGVPGGQFSHVSYYDRALMMRRL